MGRYDKSLEPGPLVTNHLFSLILLDQTIHIHHNNFNQRERSSLSSRCRFRSKTEFRFLCNSLLLGVFSLVLSERQAHEFSIFSKLSIVPRTNATLGYAQYLPSDNKLYSTEQVRQVTFTSHLFRPFLSNPDIVFLPFFSVIFK